MKSRLKKIALMDPDALQKQVDQISDKGRDILKAIEDYKFFVEQVSRVVKSDPGLTQMITNKKKNLDQASQQIYDVVFEIENMDITTSYYNQQQPTELTKAPTPAPNGVPMNPNITNAPSIPNHQPAPTPNDPTNQAPIDVVDEKVTPPGGAAPTPPPAPKPTPPAPGKAPDKPEPKDESEDKDKKEVDKPKGDSSKDE